MTDTADDAPDPADDPLRAPPGERSVPELLRFGVVNVDKPAGPSSHQLSAWVRDAINDALAALAPEGEPIDGVAHAGTLDPKVTGWQTVNNIMTPLGTSDYSQFLTNVLNSDADVLVLNHYGNDMVNSLTQAVQFGLRDREKNGNQFQIVVPLFSRLMATGAGSENIQGVYGTTNWHWTASDAGSQAFVKTFEEEYGFPPSQAAQTCYVQTLLYADACERAGTFYPPEVIKALEDHEFEGMGPGRGIYRGGDHQCFKDMFVVQGKSPSEKSGKYDQLKVVSQVDRDEVIYPVDTFPGELGPYKPA